MKITPGNPPEVISKALATIVDTADDDDLKYGPNGGFTCISSTPEEDRDGDNLYQEEWKALPDHITVDSDHGMSVATTVGSGHPYFNSEGNVQTDVSFSSIPRAQEVRTLIKEGHIRNVSVAFMTDKSKKAGEPRRELLNLGIVAVPSNRGAIILDSKALDLRAEEIAAEKRSEGAEAYPSDTEAHTEEKDSPKPYGNVTYADPEEGKYPIDTVAHIRAALAYINVPKNYAALGDHAPHVKRAIEAAARAHGIHVADDGKCYWDAEFKHEIEVDAEGCIIPAEIETKAPSGTGDGAALTQAIHDASVHLGAMCYPLQPDEDPSGASDGANKSVEEPVEEKSPELDLEALKPEGLTMEQFESALKQILTPESPEEPAPVEETAAASPAEDWARKTQLLKMRVRTRL